MKYFSRFATAKYLLAVSLATSLSVIDDASAYKEFSAEPGIELRFDTDPNVLPRIKNDEELKKMIESGDVVELPWKSNGYYLSDKFPPGLNYLLTYAKLLLDRLSDQYRSKLKGQYKITEAARTESYEEELRRRPDLHAAPSTGSKASTHLNADSFDVSRTVMSKKERTWTENVLSSLKRSGCLRYVNEGTCYHIKVLPHYKEYVSHLMSKQKIQTKSAVKKAVNG